MDNLEDFVACFSELRDVPDSIWEVLRDRVADGLSKCGRREAVIASAVAGLLIVGRVGRIPGKVCRGIATMMPIFRWAATRVGFEPVVKVKTPATMKNCFESVRNGSEQTALPVPKNQVMLGEMTMGEFVAHGSGIRIKDWLVAPAHVLAHAQRLVVKGRQHWVEIETDDPEVLDTDLCAIALTPKQWSTVGASVCSIAQTTYGPGTYVQVVGLEGKGTTGVMRDDATVFGRVTYDGTTVAGYSGSAYMAGPQLVGIHTNGGAVNGGYSASYVLVLLNQLDKEKPEDSDDWLRQQFKRGKKIRWDRKWGSPDEVRVQVDGRYAVVDRASMARAFGDKWQEELGDLLPDNWKAGNYESVTSGEASSSNPGASSLSEKSPEQSERQLQQLMSELSKLSLTRLKHLTQALKATPQTLDTQAKAPVSLV